MAELENFLTVRQAAEVANLSIRRIRQLVEQGRVQALRLNIGYLIRKDSLYRYLATRQGHGQYTKKDVAYWQAKREGKKAR